MRNAGLEETKAGVKIARRNINNLRYADDTTFMAESEELKSLLMKVKVPSGEPGVSGDFWGSQEGCQGPSRPSGRNRGLPLRRRSGQGPHLVKTLGPCGFS